MFEIIGSLYIFTIIGGIWAICRMLQYSFGTSRDYIKVPNLAWISLVIGIWIPFISFIVLAYILFWCKSVKTLMNIRDEAIQDFTPESVVENASSLILEANLVSDDWVVNVWNKKSNHDWINKLSENNSFLERSLDENMTIHVSEAEPYVAWVNVIKYFLYLEENAKINMVTE